MKTLRRRGHIVEEYVDGAWKRIDLGHVAEGRGINRAKKFCREDPRKHYLA